MKRQGRERKTQLGRATREGERGLIEICTYYIIKKQRRGRA